jgi:hypothetical protein
LYKQITTNENLKYFILGILMYSTGSSAQLKAVAYKDGSQVLNGFKIAPTKKSKKAWDFDSSCMARNDKASKDIAGDLAALGYYLHSGYLWRGELPERQCRS